MCLFFLCWIQASNRATLRCYNIYDSVDKPYNWKHKGNKEKKNTVVMTMIMVITAAVINILMLIWDVFHHGNIIPVALLHGKTVLITHMALFLCIGCNPSSLSSFVVLSLLSPSYPGWAINSCLSSSFNLQQSSHKLQPFAETFNTDLPFLPIFAISLRLWPSPYPHPFFSSLHRCHSPLTSQQLPLSLHNVFDNQFTQWQDASVSCVAEECLLCLHSFRGLPGSRVLHDFISVLGNRRICLSAYLKSEFGNPSASERRHVTKLLETIKYQPRIVGLQLITIFIVY